MNFSLLPVCSYKDLIEEKIWNMSSVIERIKNEGDSFSVPSEFYTAKDSEGNDFLSYIEKITGPRHDEVELLMSMVYQNKQSDRPYTDLICDVERSEEGTEEYAGFVCDYINKGLSFYRMIAINISSLTEVYRYTARLFSDYATFFAWRKKCYPDLLFTNDLFSKTDKIGSFQENYSEINKCLSILNDKGRELFLNGNEEEAIASIQAMCGVRCSGKGAGETETFKKKVQFGHEESTCKQYSISCIPHFKLDSAYSNKRVHFSWGREEISNHRIIVVHIGEHWSNENTTLSIIQ